MARTMFCMACGTVGKPRAETPGSLGIELVLWLLFIVPGVFYSLWRLSKRHPVCRARGSAQLIPPDSPMAKRLSSAP